MPAKYRRNEPPQVFAASGARPRPNRRLHQETDPAAAERWVDLIESKCRSLAGQPGLGRSRVDVRQDLRSLAVGSYVIFYGPIEGEIEIVRVLHGRRNIGALLSKRD